jgi:histidyl-tRNA synthetase
MIKELDGPDMPAMGFAGGLDRLLLALANTEVKLNMTTGIDLFLMYVNDDEKDYAISLMQSLRMNGFTCDIDYLKRNLKGQFKQADRLQSRYLIILNSDDIKQGLVNIKDNTTKEEHKVSESDLVDFLDMNL